MARTSVRDLQERAARALPAEQVEVVDGWWLRHHPHSSWWVGSVLPHGVLDSGDLVHRVVAAEEFYRRRDTTPLFQISPGACPAGLDALLAARGYRRHGGLSLQVAPTARVLTRAPAGALRVRWDDHPTDAWFDVWRAAHGDDGDEARAEWELLARVDRPSAYVRAMIGDDAVAVGRAVADTGWAGVFNMATLPRARGEGAADRVLAALADWAAAQHVDEMYLQVERDNAPAMRLYGRRGFRELRGYHYRIAG
ncbi:GNAT family N-acetyltransferase [Micromonospora sp. NPDC048909]|uniref:GNAT family N-acetyltransferase n=1 Tax=Micromonospora sp. NPDC048909 TaxID=3155643 RepID=UPI0033C844CE